MGHFLKRAAGLAVLVGAVAAGIHFLHQHGISLGVGTCRSGKVPSFQEPQKDPQIDHTDEAS